MNMKKNVAHLLEAFFHWFTKSVKKRTVLFFYFVHRKHFAVQVILGQKMTSGVVALCILLGQGEVLAYTLPEKVPKLSAHCTIQDKVNGVVNHGKNVDAIS